MMANNTADYNSSLPTEASSLQFQCLKPLDVAVATINTLSLLINISHLVVIMRLESLKGMPYRIILINISLIDIANTLVMAVFYSCYDFFLFNLTTGQPALKIFIYVLVTSVNYMGYYVFLVASIQKYLAICRPISYQSSSFVKNLPVSFALAWTYVLLVSVFLPLMEMLMPFQQSGADNFSIVQMLFLSIPPNITAGILLFKVFRAMKLRKRVRQSMNVANIAQASSDTRAMYLIIVFTLEMIVFILNVAAFLLFYCK